MKKMVFVYCFCILSIFSVFAQQKYALVIGNGAYSGISRLNNPVNDANDMAAALQSLGFTVDKVLDGNLDQIENAVIRLRNRLAVTKNSYGFFFYAGHGVQSNGINYLIPVGVNIPTENSLRDRAVSVQWALNELNDAGNELNVVVLDACRDNPFGWARSGNRGLSVITNQPADSIIVYATSAGSTAADGTGRNGLFTAQLLKNIKTPGLEVKEIFNRTGADVAQASDRKQIPAVYIQFFGNAYLGSKPVVAPATPPSSISEAAQREQDVVAQSEREASGHTDGVIRAVFSPDGKQIVSTSWDSTIKLWDAATGRLIRTFLHTDIIAYDFVAFSPDGKQIITHQGGMFINNQLHVAKIQLLDVATGREIRIFSDDNSRIIAFSPDSKQIIYSDGNKTIKLRDTTTGSLIRTFSGSDVVHCVAFSPDGKQIISGHSKDNNYTNYPIKLWDVATGREIRTFSGNTEMVSSVAFSPDGRQFVSASTDKTVKLWDVATGLLIRTFSGHLGNVFSATFSPDGRQIVSASTDKTVKLWDVPMGREIRTFSGHLSSVYSATFSPDGKQIVSCSYDTTIKLWDSATGKLIYTIGTAK